MIFVVSYRKKHASSKSRKSFFAEHDEQPSQEQSKRSEQRKSRQFCRKHYCASEMPGI